ncbi:chemotaxis protein CheD [Undibacterium luofuense]|uniref:chemotaxis protein CheD n=1 Tax=Undibacterium luofuense TaxID=2828733 RepID=UPI001E515F02|nr:chemotaxis protein CheD [Undibacterium luofuense]
MPVPDFLIDIFLQPGEFYFGDAETRIRTLLGSCVAITMWHPQKRIGGMCHYMLPYRKKNAEHDLDGKYAEDALKMFLREIRASRTHPWEYEIKMFGGGNQFPEHSAKVFAIPDRNIESGRQLLEKYEFQLKSEHLGGVGHRNVMFDVWSGDVWVRHVEKVMLP